MMDEEIRKKTWARVSQLYEKHARHFSLLLHPIHNNKQEPTETVVLFKPPHPYRPVIKSHTARPLHSEETRKELMLHFKSENKISTRDPRNCWMGIIHSIDG